MTIRNQIRNVLKGGVRKAPLSVIFDIKRRLCPLMNPYFLFCPDTKKKSKKVKTALVGTLKGNNFKKE